MWRYSTRQGGFSLLEVLVAFVILALSLGLIMRLFSTSLGNIDSVGRQAHAVALAQSALATLGVETPLEDGEIDGEDDQGYRWRARISRFTGEGEVLENTAAPRLYRIELSVTEAGEATKPLLALTTLKLAPKP